MSLTIPEEAALSAPSGSKARVYLDSADKQIKAIRSDGTILTVSGHGQLLNQIANGGFSFAQRQAPASATTYTPSATNRVYGPDRWGISAENASVTYQRTDAIASPETGLASRFYGRFAKITSSGKLCVSQVIEGHEVAPIRGQYCRLAFKGKNIVGLNTLKLGLLQLNSSGTVDTMPGTFISAWGAAATDPTWGTNLAAITPVIAAGTCAEIIGAGIRCVLDTAWRAYSGVFLVPNDCCNLIPVIFTNAAPATSDVFGIADVGLWAGYEERPFIPDDYSTELRRCQRYCWKSFNIDTAPAQSAGSNTGEIRWVVHTAGAVTQRGPTVHFPVNMRQSPTITTYNPNAANAEVRDQGGGAGDCSGTSTNNRTERGFVVLCTGNAGGAVGNPLGVHALADAEL